MNSLTINPGYIDAMLQIARTQMAFNTGTPLPMVAQKLIEMGVQRGVKIEVVYAMGKVNENLTCAGYYFNAPEKNKSTFMQDIYVDDNSEENLAAAMNWMARSLDELQKIPNLKVNDQ